MSSQALQDNTSAIVINVIWNVEDELKKAPAYATCVAITLYGHNYLAMIMDEAHIT